MFASSGLFSAIPCPYLPACPREAFCIYSHAPLTATDSTSTSLSQSSSTTTPADPDKNVKRKLEKTAQPEDTFNDKLSKYPRVDQRPAPRPTSSSSAKQPSTTATPAKPAIGAVLLARPQAPQKPATTSSSTSFNAKASGSGATISGPPVLKIDLRAHSKPQFRQAVATQYYNEFIRIYAPLGQTGSSLATAHAVDQEKAVHSKTNQGSYRSLAATVLQRLKKRPVATDQDDVGIDGDWIDPGQRSKDEDALDKIWKGADKFVQTIEELIAGGYPTAIPEGTPPPLEPIQHCERCQKRFELREPLTTEDKVACQYHDMRLRTKKSNGEKGKYYPCCDAPQGGPGCREGPHVFKEDDFLSLHGRTPFIETPKDNKSKRPHAVVAMDCEMCYTTGGFELIRISAIDKSGKTIMDELVKPKHNVLDLNSRFSGITSLDGAKYTLEEARSKFLELIDSNSIIIGQSLENDFKVLRLVHNRVIDTAMLYPHPHRLQGHRFSLQKLAREHLHIHIQDSEAGHDSFEDAKTCLDLVRIKIANT
ncbi:hypothetical protein B0O80DRAFT_462450 [Mortierella sp. GBAus27b]|nr:RNA exonuclease 3 [Mortierella sp. GBA43]KAI8348516.1 hypothetical protein B0O80DRAFT_462450 [Mortierella sp. GBAus27b]